MEKQDEEKTTPEQLLFIKGFNQGYLLEKHSPELLKQVLADQGDSKLPMIQGLKSGAKEFQKEKVLSLMKGKEKERDKGFSR